MFKFLGLACLGLIACASCTHNNKIVEQHYVDSLVNNYALPAWAESIEDDAKFWHKRINIQPDNFVASEKYVHSLIARFQLYSDIRDLKAADSMLVDLDNKPPSSTSQIKLTLAQVKMLQHQFGKASEIIQAVERSGEERSAMSMLKFDANFELGNYTDSKLALTANHRRSEFAYHFRLAKQNDQEGSIYDAIQHMKEAAATTENPYLKTTALSNAADFYMHSGDVNAAYQLYKQCIQINAADFHSIEMLGWLALVHDNNIPLAEKIFHFLKNKKRSPEILLQLSRTYETTDIKRAIEYAIQFVQAVTDPAYGDMYSKYLIEVYTGLLNDPVKALQVAEREIVNRKTPQTYAWLIFSLYSTKQQASAYQLFQDKVSGHSLEGTESFMMARFLMSIGKENEAGEYLEAAKTNIYELTPSMANEIIKLTNDKN